MPDQEFDFITPISLDEAQMRLKDFTQSDKPINGRLIEFYEFDGDPCGFLINRTVKTEAEEFVKLVEAILMA